MLLFYFIKVIQFAEKMIDGLQKNCAENKREATNISYWKRAAKSAL